MPKASRDRSLGTFGKEMTHNRPKLSREESLKKLEELIAETDSSSEPEVSDLARPLMALFREIVDEANSERPDKMRLGILHDAVYAFFKQNRFSKGFGYSLTWIDTICGREEK
jgi:hypothetical protein